MDDNVFEKLMEIIEATDQRLTQLQDINMELCKQIALNAARLKIVEIEIEDIVKDRGLSEAALKKLKTIQEKTKHIPDDADQLTLDDIDTLANA